MTDPSPQLEPLAIEERSAATTRAAHALRIATGNKYLVFRSLVDTPDGPLFHIGWDGAEWLLTADEALLMAAIAARAKHGAAGYEKVSYRRGMLLPEAPRDTPPSRTAEG